MDATEAGANELGGTCQMSTKWTEGSEYHLLYECVAHKKAGNLKVESAVISNSRDHANDGACGKDALQ